MNLLEYTQSHGATTRSRTRGALLLSMLPYGLIYKADAAAWYTGGNGSAKIAELVSVGLIKEYTQHAKSKKHPYTVRFLGLTGRGIHYLADGYGQDYPWLRQAAARIAPGEEISFRKVRGEATVTMLLRIQSANVFFNRVGTTTIIDRLRYNPYQALCAMRILTNNVTMQHSFLTVLADALEAWLRRVRPAIRKPPPDDHDRGTYYDAIEMRAPQINPYTTPRYLCAREEYVRGDDKACYRTSYIGVLRTGQRVYLVYRSNRDGASWNGNSVRNNWESVQEQLQRLGLLRTSVMASHSLPSILLVDGVGRGVAAFARVCRDNRHVRKGADKALGRGASSVYIMPMTECTVWMMRAFLRLSAGETTYAEQLKQALCAQWPALFSRNPLDVEMDMRYRDLPCSFGVDYDIKAINHCLDWDAERRELERRGATEEELARCRFAIVCFRWQVEYYRCLFPSSVTIVAIDDENEVLLEYAPPAE